MNKQPDALRLAEDLDAYHTRSTHKEAAYELRRLNAVNNELLAALKRISQQCPPYEGDYTLDAIPSDFGGNSEDHAREMQAIADAQMGDIARAAIAKAEGGAA